MIGEYAHNQTFSVFSGKDNMEFTQFAHSYPACIDIAILGNATFLGYFECGFGLSSEKVGAVGAYFELSAAHKEIPV